MQKNKQNELLRLQNLVTWFINVMNSPALAQAGINLAPIIKDIVNKAEISAPDDVTSGMPAMLGRPPMPQQQPPAGAPGQQPKPQATPAPQQKQGVAA